MQNVDLVLVEPGGWEGTGHCAAVCSVNVWLTNLLTGEHPSIYSQKIWIALPISQNICAPGHEDLLPKDHYQ